MLKKLSLWYTSLHLISTNRLKPPSTPSNYVRHRLENSMVSTLSSCSGLFIHWGVYESGKTIATRHAAQRLQDNCGRTVIWRNGYELWGLLNAGCDLFAHLDLPCNPLSQVLCQPTTLIIDDFDTFVWPALKKDETLMTSFLALSAEACSAQDFNILLVFKSWVSAKEFKRLANAKLVAHPDWGRWMVDELNALKEITPTTRAPGDADQILSYAIAGSSPGLLKFNLTDAEPLKVAQVRSQIYQREWTNGILALTGGDPLGPGRFPDGDGRFHWD